MVLANKNADSRSKILVVAGILAMVLVSLFATPALAADNGDIKVEASDSEGEYSGEIALYDIADNEVERDTTSDGELTFEEVEHGDYYLEATDQNGSTVQSETFTHEADVTELTFDVESNSLTVEQVDQNIDYVAPTPDNVADFVQNPGLPALIGMLLVGAVWLAIIVGGFMLLIFLLRVVR